LNEVAGGVDEEYYRILQEAKPSEVPTGKKVKKYSIRYWYERRQRGSRRGPPRFSYMKLIK